MVQGSIAEEIKSERQNQIELIRKWGDVNTDGLLEESCQFFSSPGIEGFIGYKEHADNAVVFGDPVCSLENKPRLAQLFQEYCSSRNVGVVYTIVSQEFADWAEKNQSAVMVEFGEKFVLDPFHNPTNNTGSKAVLVRKKVKQAIKDGVTVEEYRENNPEIEKQIEDVAIEWLKKRHGPQIYLSHVSLFKDRFGKRWFYGKQNNRIVGLLMLNEIQAKKGWLMNNLMIVKDAPHGLSELLVISALQTLEKENCHYVLIGPVPGDQLGKISGVGEFQAGFIRWLYKCAKLVFHLTGHETFWQKFQPEIQGSYLIFPQKNVGYSSIKALLKAFNVGMAK